MTLVAAGTLFVALRARWIGHPLVWDEAMNLCSWRSFVSGGNDQFSAWFWRHPPLFCLPALALRPLAAGYAERVQGLALAIGVLNLFLLYAVNARFVGRRVASLSVIVLAALPGAAFFDVWVKRDHLVATFGLLALYVLPRSVWLAGLSLGLALLSKETAVFYVAPLLGLWAVGVTGRRSVRDLCVLLGVAALTSAWWLAFGESDGVGAGNGSPGGYLASFARFALRPDGGWSGSPLYYAGLWPLHLGWAGTVLLLPGLAVAAWAGAIRRPAPSPGTTAEARFPGAGWAADGWAALLLVVALTVLSLLPSKVPWVTMVLFPAYATVIAQGINALCGLVRRPPWAAAAAPTLAAVAFAASAGGWRADYDDLLRRTAPNQWKGASMSRAIAAEVNRRVQPGQRLLLTSFYYWKDIVPGRPCAVFTWYFAHASEVAVLLRPHTLRAAQLAADAERHGIDWAVLSPEPGAPERDVVAEFVDRRRCRPVVLPGAFVFHLDHAELPSAAIPPE